MTQPVTRPDTECARGVLMEADDDRIVFAVPGTEYQLHLLVYQKPTTPIGQRLTGIIRAQARRIDVVHRGGKYIEPLYGHPRRVQGEIIAIDPAGRSVTVDAGVPIVCSTDERQVAQDFGEGDFVSFDVLPGASFTPANEPGKHED